MHLRVLRPWLALLPLTCLSPPTLAAPPAAVTNRVDLRYDVQADGQYTATMHIERQANTPAAAQSLNVFPWEFSPTHEDVQIIAAYTLKPDGTKIPVNPAAIRDQAPDPSSPIGALTDNRAKLIPFLQVTAGDSIVVDLRDHVFRPRLPGVFSLALLYDRSQAWDDAKVSVTVPDSVILASEAVGPKVVSAGTFDTYRWRYHDTDIVPQDAGVLAPIERLPHLLVTTATDWQQIGHAYAALALPQAKVTPLVQQTADTAAAGFTDHRAIAEQLFAWVRDNIHYQDIPLGEGNVTPHSADATVTTHTGDSGDEAVLLFALLAAKGIHSDLVLIDSDNVYRLSVPAPFAQLNHVILYLPEVSAYADPTIATSRVGVLPFNECGKPAIYAVTSNEIAHTTPTLAPDAASMSFTTTAHLTDSGMIVGDSGTVGTGPFGVRLLQAARLVTAEGADAAGTRQIRAEGEIGTASFNLPPTIAANGGEVLSGHFTVSVWPHLSADHRLLMPDGLRALPRTGDLLIGPLDASVAADAATPCYAGKEAETTTVAVGPEYKVVQVPQDRKIVSDAFTYTSHWSTDGTEVSVHRELVSRVTQPVCDGALRQQAAAAIRAIINDDGQRVALQPGPPKAVDPAKAGAR